VAKKVRRKPEEDEQFEFPSFDEGAFVAKEGEMSRAMVLASLAAIALGAASWALTESGVPWWGPLLLGLAGLVLTPMLVRRIRPQSSSYTKGDWAGLLALTFFGWLALWFVLVNLG
jgi:hypothetical protein